MVCSLFGNSFFEATRQIPPKDHDGEWQEFKRLTQSLADSSRRGIRWRLFEVLCGDDRHSGGKTSRTVKSTQNKPCVLGNLSSRACPMSLGGSCRFCHQVLSAGSRIENRQAQVQRLHPTLQTHLPSGRTIRIAGCHPRRRFPRVQWAASSPFPNA